MGNFFRGWRRKLGVVTLLLACVAMGGWVRSLVIKDRIDFCNFTGFAKQDNRLAGLATDRQSLIILVYKVDEVVYKSHGRSMSYLVVQEKGL